MAFGADPAVAQGADIVATLKSFPNPGVAGQPVTFTVTVSAAAGGGTPTGTVSFFDAITQIGVVHLAGGLASFTTSTLVPGNHLISASYLGDGTFHNTSIGSLIQTVTQAQVPNTTMLMSSLSPSTVGQPVTFTATVSSEGAFTTPTGTMTFKDGGTTLATVTLTAGPASRTTGQAILTTSALTAGSHSITAIYSGDANFSSSIGALTQIVQGNTQTTSVKLRTMQVQTTQMVAQVSGNAITEAIATAISDGFSDDVAFATPSANGGHINFAGQLASAQQSPPDGANAPDPALGRAAVLSNSGLTPAMRNFAAPASSNPARIELSSINPGSADPAQTGQGLPAPTLTGPTPPAWQVWADVHGSGWDTTASAGDIQGTQANALMGITRRLTPDLLVGALTGYEHFDYTSQLLNGRLQGDGWTVGGYLGWHLDQQIRFDAAVARSGVSYNDTAGTATGSFQGSRWLASAGLTGTYRLEPFEIEPSARVFTLWEHENPYTDSLGTPQSGFNFTTGRASGGLKLSYTLASSPTITLTPYLGLYGDYYLSSDNGGTSLLPANFIRGGAGRVTAGIAARFDNGTKVSFDGEYGGIGNDFQNWTVMARATIPLSLLFGSETSATAARSVSSRSVAATMLADAPRARQLASLEPDSAMLQMPPAEQIIVGFRKHAVLLTPSGRQALDEAVADTLAGKKVLIVIAGCESGTDDADGSVCARRAARLTRLLAGRGVKNPSGLMAALQKRACGTGALDRTG